MPHMEYSAGELDKMFPPLEAPPEEGLEDLDKDGQDTVFQHGLSIARAIQAEADIDGRRRRPRTDATQTLQLLEESLDLATQAGRQLSDEKKQCEVARNHKDKLKSDSEARELRDEVEPDRPSKDIGVNRVRVRPPRHAQFPTRTAAPRTDLPGSECAYARRLRAGEDTM